MKVVITDIQILLVKSGSGLLTDGYQDSNGITDGVLKDTITLPFGDIEATKKILEKEDMKPVLLLSQFQQIWDLSKLIKNF